MPSFQLLSTFLLTSDLVTVSDSWHNRQFGF